MSAGKTILALIIIIAVVLGGYLYYTGGSLNSLMRWGGTEWDLAPSDTGVAPSSESDTSAAGVEQDTAAIDAELNALSSDSASIDAGLNDSQVPQSQ